MESSAPNIRTWLYTSELRDGAAYADVIRHKQDFADKNREYSLSGFLITNGSHIMQLLEGETVAVEQFKATISADQRHRNLDSIIWDMVPHRAYPKWSMKFHAVEDYEVLFKEIESAQVETIATQTARLLFDMTFDE